MYYDWQPYVPVAQKLANARRCAEKQAQRENRKLAPVVVRGRKLATKFWGQAWCENLDHYSDIANRLARGRRYLGNGSVVDLQIKCGKVEALVAGSEVYEVKINIKPLPAKAWKEMRRACAASIHSLFDLLQGRFDEGVMRRLAQREGGLFPQPQEIEMECSCPDYAYVCKHIAAVMYGVGVRLDTSPELLFTLRNVDHADLISAAVASENLEELVAAESSLAGSDLGEMFGINLDSSSAPKPARKPRKASVKALVIPLPERTAPAKAKRRKAIAVKSKQPVALKSAKRKRPAK